MARNKYVNKRFIELLKAGYGVTIGRTRLFQMRTGYKGHIKYLEEGKDFEIQGTVTLYYDSALAKVAKAVKKK